MEQVSQIRGALRVLRARLVRPAPAGRRARVRITEDLTGAAAAPVVPLHRYLADHPGAAHPLGAADPEPVAMADLVALADEETTSLWQRLVLDRPDRTGHPLLRQEIANLYELIAPDQVLLCAGADAALSLTLSTLLGRGDHAVVTWPSSGPLDLLARAARAQVTRIGLDYEQGWALDVDAIRAVIRPTTRAIVINFPHNPTGALPPRAALKALLDLAEEIGAYVVSDESLRLLERDPADRWPAATDRWARAISIGTVSMPLGLPGLRVGWIATRDRDALERITIRHDYMAATVSAPGQVLALAGLRAREHLLGQVRGLLRDNLALVSQFLADHGDLMEWVPPRAGTVAFPRLTARVPVGRFAAELAAEAGVLVLPAEVFGFPGNHFRLGFGRADLPEALAGLERFIRARMA